MPSRLVCLGIVGFWLATSTWLMMREILPRFQAGEAPNFTIDLLDEVNANTASWTVFYNDNRIGTGVTQVRRRRNRTFVLSNEVRFNDLVLGGTEIRSVRNAYRVTPAGKLLGVTVGFKFRQAAALGLKIRDMWDMEIELHGDVENGEIRFTPYFISNLYGKTQKQQAKGFPVPPPVPVPDKGTFLNPMHLVNKISGLHDGQSWRIPLFDPLAMKKTAMPAFLLKEHKEVLATVKADKLEWGDKWIACQRIDYTKSDEVVASTWVRRVDGLVLQQEASHMGLKLKLVRDN